MELQSLSMNTASLQSIFMLCLRGLSHASKAFRLVLVLSFAFLLLSLCGHRSSAEIQGSGEYACRFPRNDYGPYGAVAVPSFENVCPNPVSFCFPSTLRCFPLKESGLELVGPEDVAEFGLLNGSWEIGPRDFKYVVELNRKATSDDLIAEALNSNENFNICKVTRYLTKVLEAAEPEECVLATWKSQGTTNNDVSVPQGCEVLLFPVVQALFWARVEKALQPALLAAFFMFLSLLPTFPAAGSESRSRTPIVHYSKKIKKPSKTGGLLDPDNPEAKEAEGEGLDAPEEPKPGSLAVRTGKEKGRRRRKRKGPPEVSSSQSGSSTPTSPEAGQSNPPTKAASKKDRVLEHASCKVTKSKSDGKPVLASTSRLALQDRAPGPKRCSKKDLKPDEYTYDIWGDHYSGLKSIYNKDSDSESFFVRATHPQNCISAEFCKFIQ